MYDWLPAKTTKRKFDSGQLADRFVPSRRTMDYHEGRCFIYDNRSPLQESILPPRCYQKPHRKICCEPYETVVMESVPDDFYLDILDWSDYGWVAIGHGTSITLMNPTTRKERFKEAPYPTTYEIASSKPDRYGPSSVRFHRDKLAVGQKQGTLHIMDVPTMTWIQHTSPHAHCRIGALDWCDQNIVATGANDLKGTVLHDLRQKGPVAMMPHHEQICGLRWAPHRSDMLAVGTNDNLLKIWDIRKGVAAAFLHRAAVKAIAWSPKHSGVVGTGGGSNDQKVRFFDVRNNSLLHCVKTGSQVCNLLFSQTENEFISSHGFDENEIVVWDFPSMTRIARLRGHKRRVLYVALSPDGSTVVSGSSDNRLSFWKLWKRKKSMRPEPCTPLHRTIR